MTITLAVPRKLNLDIALEWIGRDELVEVTPQSVRVRKTILDVEDRKRAERKMVALAG
jgi:GTP-binding protein